MYVLYDYVIHVLRAWVSDVYDLASLGWMNLLAMNWNGAYPFCLTSVVKLRFNHFSTILTLQALLKNLSLVITTLWYLTLVPIFFQHSSSISIDYRVSTTIRIAFGTWCDESGTRAFIDNVKRDTNSWLPIKLTSSEASNIVEVASKYSASTGEFFIDNSFYNL